MAGRSPATDAEKRAAAWVAARLIRPGMTVGLGSGSTVAALVEVLAQARPDACFVAASPATAATAEQYGLPLVALDSVAGLDLAIDGADQIAPDGWVIKGGGGAHVREKVVAAAADRFVVIGSSDKPVDRLTPPVPVEILAFGVAATLKALEPTTLRPVAPSPDGGLIADCMAPFGDPAAQAAWLDSVPGMVGHGLFGPDLVTDVLIARGEDVEHRRIR